MNHEQRERLVDSALDRALGPQLVEPRDGFEERILANLPQQASRRPWWQWLWIPALAAAAVLAVVIGMRVMHRETSPVPVQANKTVTAPKQEVARKPEPPAAKPVPPVIAKHRAPKNAAKPYATVAVTEPRLDVFPSRGTLTPEEKLLVAFVRQQPSHARAVALEQEARAEEVQKFLDKGQVPVAGPSGITK